MERACRWMIDLPGSCLRAPDGGRFARALCFVAMCVIGSLAASQAWADEPIAEKMVESLDPEHEHHSDHEHTGAHEHHQPTIMGEPPKNYFGPRTEFLYWSPQLFIWTLLLFLPLWFLLTRLVWKPMIQAVEERDRRLEESLQEAERLRDQARSMTLEQDAETIRAQQEARALLDNARADATAQLNEKLAQANEQAAADLQAARNELDAAVAHGEEQIQRAAENVGREITEVLVSTGNGKGGGSQS